MVAVESTVVEQNGHTNGYRFAPLENLEAPEKSPIKEQAGARQRGNEPASSSVESSVSDLHAEVQSFLSKVSV